MRAAVLTIGTEITRGEIVDTNAAWLAGELTALGLEVIAIAGVDDDRERIGATLGRLAESVDAVVATGGLGPTTDDLTRDAVAVLLGVELERDPSSLEAIRERMTRHGRTMAPSNERQANFPKGATVLPNAHGTAPGFAVNVDGTRAFFLPGVPVEMKPMFAEHVAPALSGSARESIVQIRLGTFGLPESTVNDRLEGIEAEHDVVIAYRAHFPEIQVKIVGRGGDAATAGARARAGADAARDRLGDVVYAEGDVTLAEAVGELLKAQGWVMGTAESCTGGLVAELLTERGGSSDFFAGSIVSYSNAIKASNLGVPEAMLAEHGAVSEPVARRMAEGARQRLDVDVAVALTGIAGPGGGSDQKPVGLVHYAAAWPEGVVARHRIFPGNRDRVRRRSAFAALDLVRRLLSGAELPS